ncbi:MAG: hypothetical protein M0R03_22655 [Novosphingobium sp.]|nr:hypothetical protein [Novosphingobium sp.]
MSTPYSEIFDLFMSSIASYELDDLFNKSVSDFETRLTGWLIKAIPNFDGCLKNLENRDDNQRCFFDKLDTDEKVVLSNLMIVEFLKKEVNDIRQMRQKLGDPTFKAYSEANNLKERVNLLNTMNNQVQGQITRYQYKNLNSKDL